MTTLANVSQDVFELTLARPVATPVGEHATDVHLWWRAPMQGERLVQIYVDGALHDVTADATQRAVWLSLDRTRPHRIELLALPATHAWHDHADRLAGWDPEPSSSAMIQLLRDEALPPDAVVHVAVDDEPTEAAPLWPGEVARSGFGGLFGLGRFGFDDAAGPGLGIGELGFGPLGRGGTRWRWSRDDLPAGGHTLTVEARDAAGHALVPPVDLGLTINHLPEPIRDLAVSTDFTLTWSLPDA